MTIQEVLDELRQLGGEQTRKVLMQHGAKEPVYGVKVEDLKKVLKRIKGDQKLAMELYDSGVYDAMYLAGLAADGALMTRKQIQSWALKASSTGISEYTVPWVTSEHPEGFDIALEWIDAKKDALSSCGWSALTSIVSVRPDENLDINKLSVLLDRVARTIHVCENRTRYAMNGFVISVGAYVPALTRKALDVGAKIGEVTVDMRGTACKVPSVTDYIRKIEARGSIGKKKKTAKC
jgi:hypothetical protein